jgi:hypothetical protein
MDNPQIRVYRHPNPEIRSYLSAEDLTTPRVEHFQGPPDQITEDRLKSLGTIGAQIVRDVMAIPGVREIRIKPKEIRMTKQTGASWEDIESKVLEVLQRALTRKQLKLVRP